MTEKSLSAVHGSRVVSKKTREPTFLFILRDFCLLLMLFFELFAHLRTTCTSYRVFSDPGLGNGWRISRGHTLVCDFFSDKSLFLVTKPALGASNICTVCNSSCAMILHKFYFVRDRSLCIIRY